VGPYVLYSLFQTTGGMCAKFGSDRFRNGDLYRVQTNKQTYEQTFIFMYKIIRPVVTYETETWTLTTKTEKSE
jgi:hypothetical protein